MNAFQSLLDPESTLSPGEQQSRASEALSKIVNDSHLQWWKKSSSRPRGKSWLLLVVAPWSHYDLAMLDLLDETFSDSNPTQSWQSDQVFVANIENYRSLEELQLDIPCVDRLPAQSPVVAKRHHPKWEWGCGKAGRDLVARTIGFEIDDFNRKVIARVPTVDIATSRPRS